MTLIVHGPTHGSAVDCEKILRSLPDWFCIEASLLEYAGNAAILPTFIVQDHSGMIGFLSLRQHFPHAWEIDCIAVRKGDRGRGLGRLLLECAERWLGESDARLLQVKTIAATHPSVHYGQTGAFYSHMGFIEIEVFQELWDPSHPCLLMMKPIVR